MRKTILFLFCLFLVSNNLSGQCTGTDLLGSSSNMNTIIPTDINNLAVNNDLHTLIFIHRNNSGIFGGHSGELRFDISTNDGTTWTTNQGVLNPLSVNGTNGARFPGISIYNPPGNTIPNNAYMVYLAATTAADWNGHVMGVRKLDGTGNTENYNQTGASETEIPKSIVKGAPGVFWAMDKILTASGITGFRILKGVWNGSNDVVWSVNYSVNGGFDTVLTGSVHLGDIEIGFDPTGQIGWACALTHTTPLPAAYAYYPNFWKTTDGGTTWTGPEQIDLSQFSCISENIDSGFVASSAFDMDLTVDCNGNPHALLMAANGSNAYTIYTSNWKHLFDVTQEHGIWNAVDIDSITGGTATFGISPSTVQVFFEPQASRTDDGTKVFFTWSCSDTTLNPGQANQDPNLFGIGYDVVNRNWTTVRNFSSCNVATAGKIFFPKLAENVINLAGGGWELPLVYGEFTLGTNPSLPANFRYLDSLTFANADFLNPQCTDSISFDQGDTVAVCPGGNSLLSISGSYEAILWSTGSTTAFATAPTAGWYYASARSGCCISTDSIFVTLDSLLGVNANFISSSNELTADFTDISSPNPSLWFWDFGDGGTSTIQNPQHMYSAAGTYLVCLIASNPCGADTICDSITITCTSTVSNFTFAENFYLFTFSNSSSGGPGLTYSWDFGDGNTSSVLNPQHLYAAIGNYMVCLIATSPCGADTLCQEITVTCSGPNPNYIFNSIGLTVNFVNTSPSFTSLVWDFGDGASSTATNPSHTYSAYGAYWVCLTATDSCGTETLCDSLNLSLIGTPDSFNGRILVYPNPTNENFSVHLEFSALEIVKLELMNLQGQILWSSNEVNGNSLCKIPTQALAPGVYLLQAHCGDQSVTLKLMKK